MQRTNQEKYHLIYFYYSLAGLPRFFQHYFVSCLQTILEELSMIRKQHHKNIKRFYYAKRSPLSPSLGPHTKMMKSLHYASPRTLFLICNKMHFRFFIRIYWSRLYVESYLKNHFFAAHNLFTIKQNIHRFNFANNLLNSCSIIEQKSKIISLINADIKQELSHIA